MTKYKPRYMRDPSRSHEKWRKEIRCLRCGRWLVSSKSRLVRHCTECEKLIKAGLSEDAKMPPEPSPESNSLSKKRVNRAYHHYAGLTVCKKE